MPADLPFRVAACLIKPVRDKLYHYFRPAHSGGMDEVMNNHMRVYRMVVAALLCAIGIVIPMFSPLKIILEPMSFTLASHVAIMVAMFISPTVAISVSLGTTLGFFLGGFPLVVVLRALSQVIFVVIGALWLKKHPYTLASVGSNIAFNCVIALIHALGEIVVVMYFYFGNLLPESNYTKGFAVTVLLLVGVGTFVHSTVDFYISVLLWKALGRSHYVSELFTAKVKKPA